MVDKKVFRCIALTKKYKRCKNKLMYSKSFKKYCYCHKKNNKLSLSKKNDTVEEESCHLLIFFNIYLYLVAVFMFYIMKI